MLNGPVYLDFGWLTRKAMAADWVGGWVAHCPQSKEAIEEDEVGVEVPPGNLRPPADAHLLAYAKTSPRDGERDGV